MGSKQLEQRNREAKVYTWLEVRCDFGMMPPNSDQPGVVTSATRVTLLGYVRGLCESQEGWAAYRKSHEDAALERPPERRDQLSESMKKSAKGGGRSYQIASADTRAGRIEEAR